ncbi:MAG TPA: hypothetical protein VFH48_11625 [Chloroflexota bacterium]|nr:hypothetical protein [Chloroflexota bacterium]
MNDSYFNTVSYNSPAWRRLVMCQEIAHGFGLGHQDEKFDNKNLGSCMDYTNAPSGGVVNGFDYGDDNEHPNAHDFAQLEMIYAHTDSTTTVGQAAAPAPCRFGPAQDEGPNAPVGFGRPVGPRDQFGRYDLFGQILPDNNSRLYTHVFWVHPGHPNQP